MFNESRKASAAAAASLVHHDHLFDDITDCTSECLKRNLDLDKIIEKMSFILIDRWSLSREHIFKGGGWEQTPPAALWSLLLCDKKNKTKNYS